MSISLDVAVVGGGIAGLATAAALRRTGHKVTVYEQSRFLNEVGAAIHVAPNAARVLKSIGFDTERARAVQNSWSYNCNGITMEETWSRSLDYILKEFGTPWYLFHRVDLHNELKRLAFEDGPGQPAALKLDCRVVSVDADNTTVALVDGTIIKADVIIGADGVHSKTIRAVTETGSPATSTGQAAYRFIISIEELLKEPETSWLVKDKPVTMNIFPIEDRRIACYPCRSNTLFNFVAIHPRGDEDAVEDWNVSASLSCLLETYNMYHPSLKAILRKAESMEDVKLWKLLSRSPLSSWIKGNVAVIGDAAHPMLPHSGQGGGQSIEDAAALSILLSDLTSKSDIPQRLQAFQDVRFRRASAIQILSNHGQDQAHKSRALARRYVEGPHVPANQREIHTFIYSYHVLEESNKALEALKNGTYHQIVWQNGRVNFGK